MSDGYITSKQLSGNEAHTGVARTEAKAAAEKKENALKLAKQMAAQIVEEERQKKSNKIYSSSPNPLIIFLMEDNGLMRMT